MITKIEKKSIVLATLGASLALLLLLFATARVVWRGKYYPGVKIAGQQVEGMSREQANAWLAEKASSYRLKLEFNGSTWEIPQSVYEINVAQTTAEAYRFGRRYRLEDYGSLVSIREENFPVIVTVNEASLNEWLTHVSPYIEIVPVFPKVELVKGQIKITNGQDGLRVDQEELVRRVQDKIAQLDDSTINAPLKEEKRQLDEDGVARLRAQAGALQKDTLTLLQDDTTIKLGGAQLVTHLTSDESLAKFLDTTATKIEREPQDAKFKFENGKVLEFAPSRDGIKLRREDSLKAIRGAIEKLIASESALQVELVVDRVAPKIETSKVNDLGIRERIGRGESYYAHSIPNRVFNVGLAAERVNGTLIAPGGEFSFNKYVGEVSGATGYRTAYVISGGRTVLGDGGGVCQVSTTIFRAAMNAGLEISERWGHAYRVGYYEQNSDPGLDATVYAPSKDFRFVNNTPGHILVQTINDPKSQHLVIEIYGTKDARIATVSKPKVWGVSPPLPTIYEDDPNLPAGTLKQVDWAAYGARTSFDYKVMRDGEVLFEKTYTTNYRPWADVYMRGTGGEVAQ